MSKRVVHIIHHDDIGGGGTVIVKHLRYYGKKYDTTVLHGGSGSIAKACRELDIRSIQVPLDTKLKSIAGFFYLIYWLSKIQPQLVILHGQWGGPVGTLAGLFARVPRMLYIAHWPSFYTDWDTIRVVRNYLTEWIPMHYCDRVITLSAANRYQYMIRSRSVERKICSLSNMIDLDKTPSAEAGEKIRRDLGWNPALVHVVSVGRLARQKRVDWLLRSWKRVQESDARARLWIVGGGSEEKKLQALANELQIGQTCTFLGSRPNGTEFLKAADIVAMPTLYEGHALIPLETMACGRPIVANAADGVRDTFIDGEEGFLVPPASTVLFADRLLKLIGDATLRETMGQKGLLRVRRYDSQIVLARYVELIEKELDL